MVSRGGTASAVDRRQNKFLHVSPYIQRQRYDESFPGIFCVFHPGETDASFIRRSTDYIRDSSSTLGSNIFFRGTFETETLSGRREKWERSGRRVAGK